MLKVEKLVIVKILKCPSSNRLYMDQTFKHEMLIFDHTVNFKNYYFPKLTTLQMDPQLTYFRFKISKIG